jgi:hypothetical protein
MFPKQKSLRRGDITMALILSLVAIAIAIGLGSLLKTRITTGIKESERVIQNVEMINGAETLILAYRHQESQYQTQVAACASANPMFTAIKLGHNCRDSNGNPQNPGTVRLFANQPPAFYQNAFSYPADAPCIIAPNANSGPNTCINQSRVRVRIAGLNPNQNQPLLSRNYDFALVAVKLPRNMVDFSVRMSSPANANLNQRAVIGVKNVFSNTSHIDWEGKVFQELSDPFGECALESWDLYKIFDPIQKRCLTFSQLGGGNGLHMYQARFFGFRSNDGQVVDLSGLMSGTNYMVQEDGRLSAGSPQIHPAYSKPLLQNADDLTILETRNSGQIYFVRGQGQGAYIGAYIGSTLHKLCDLANSGFAQSFVGIGVLPWSDPAVPETNDGYDTSAPRITHFFLKTDLGDYLLAQVLRSDANTAPTCTVFKDSSIQKEDYKRSLGFDRIQSERPYLIY